MENNQKYDNLYVNTISKVDDVKNVSQNAVGNAGKDPHCVLNHQRHAIGSIKENNDGSKSVCTEDSSWKTTK